MCCVFALYMNLYLDKQVSFQVRWHLKGRDLIKMYISYTILY